jgi:hypothetical protein
MSTSGCSKTQSARLSVSSLNSFVLLSCDVRRALWMEAETKQLTMCVSQRGVVVVGSQGPLCLATK